MHDSALAIGLWRPVADTHPRVVGERKSASSGRLLLGAEGELESRPGVVLVLVLHAILIPRSADFLRQCPMRPSGDRGRMGEGSYQCCGVDVRSWSRAKGRCDGLGGLRWPAPRRLPPQQRGLLRQSSGCDQKMDVDAPVPSTGVQPRSSGAHHHAVAVIPKPSSAAAIDE